MIGSPIYSWKNLTTNPNVRIRGDIAKVSDVLPRLKLIVDKIKTNSKSIKKAISELASLDIKIKKKENELKKAKTEKKRTKLDKESKALLKKKESITKKHQGVEAEYIKNASDTYVEFEDLTTIFFRLNVMPLTLIHRARKDINDLIEKIRPLKHENAALLEKLKAQSIVELNKDKQYLKSISKQLYIDSKSLEGGVFNPVESLREANWIQGIPLRCRKIRQRTIAIDNVEGRIENIRKNLKIPQIPQFARTELKEQIGSIDFVAHQVKVLTHRFNQILDKYPENHKLKKKFKKRLRNIVKQSRLLWNHIEIKTYKAKIVKFPKLKPKQIKKVA